MAKRLRVEQAPIGAVRPHPANPRPVNPERVETMSASYQADPTILERHPILVTEQDGGYTVISGHHRLAMAQSLRLPKVWVDVWEMTPEEAYFELVRANELEPMDLLSYGLHFVRMPERMLPGQYAKAIGRSATFVAAARRAAEVYEALPETLRARVPGEYSGWFLSHIGKADGGRWVELTEIAFTNGLSLRQTESLVNEYNTAKQKPLDPTTEANTETDESPYIDDEEPGGTAGERRDRSDDGESVFSNRDPEAGDTPRPVTVRSGGGEVDPREVFGLVLRMFREAQECVSRINTNELDREQKVIARQLLQSLMDALG